MNNNAYPHDEFVFNISHPENGGILYVGLMSVGKFAETTEESIANVKNIPTAMSKFKELLIANLKGNRTPIEAAMKARKELIKFVPESDWLITFVPKNDIVHLSY